MAKVYALYKGDEYIADGTLEELARKTGKKIKLSLKMLSEWWGKAHFAVRVAGHKERIYER